MGKRLIINQPTWRAMIILNRTAALHHYESSTLHCLDDGRSWTAPRHPFRPSAPRHAPNAVPFGMTPRLQLGSLRMTACCSLRHVLKQFLPSIQMCECEYLCMCPGGRRGRPRWSFRFSFFFFEYSMTIWSPRLLCRRGHRR